MKVLVLLVITYLVTACDPFHEIPKQEKISCEKDDRLYWKRTDRSNDYWDGECSLKELSFYYDSSDEDVQVTISALKEITQTDDYSELRQALEGLTSLDFSAYTQITTLKPLAGLNNLESLSLANDSQIEGFWPLYFLNMDDMDSEKARERLTISGENIGFFGHKKEDCPTDPSVPLSNFWFSVPNSVQRICSGNR